MVTATKGKEKGRKGFSGPPGMAERNGTTFGDLSLSDLHLFPS